MKNKINYSFLFPYDLRCEIWIFQ